MKRIFASILKAAESGQSPKALKWVWKQVYNVMSLSWRDQDWRFMNYGYIAPGAEPFQLSSADETDRAFIGLYHQAIDGLDLTGKRVLEVGSGRGGGTSYVARYGGPAEIVGADFSPATVKIAERLNADVPALSFTVGDAENLPFPDDSFDVVLNIESSHCYSDVGKFIEEVARVLKPGGTFTWADIRGRTMMTATEEHFAKPSLEKVYENELTPGVIAALDAMHERKSERIGKSWFFKRFMSEFAATKGTKLYQGFKGGHVRYLARRYVKKSV